MSGNNGIPVTPYMDSVAEAKTVPVTWLGPVDQSCNGVVVVDSAPTRLMQGRTKAASGQLWCWAGEPVPLRHPYQVLMVREGKDHIAVHAYKNSLAEAEREMIDDSGRAVSTFAGGLSAGAKADKVSIGVHPIQSWVRTSEGNHDVIDAVHFAA
eukprot:24702-Pelagomonas_calceolata.AAC.4